MRRPKINSEEQTRNKLTTLTSSHVIVTAPPTTKPKPDMTTATKMDPFAAQIWDMKYRLKAEDGTPIDQTIEDTWSRVAKALAAAEAPKARVKWEKAFRQAMEGFRFIPAGRILAGAGTPRKVSLFNCFVMGTVEDDLSSIFEHLRQAALTLQAGGGIGYDFSTLRPKGAKVASIGADASGPLSFMEVWDAMCRTIMSAGTRRGAMMATLACDHPDIEAFIDAKRQPGRLTNFNLSVLVTDAFVEAVRADADWPLAFGARTFRTLKARKLWDRMMRATYDCAEPGVIFIDRINAENNLGYCETISATNPCGEQPLPPYGACLLGSINLAALVRDPFEASAHIDESELGKLVRTAVRMLDNAIDVSRFPLKAQSKEAHDKRRIGLGITGLADALIACGLVYGSRGAGEAAGRWMALIERQAYLASTGLAAEKGAFPLFDRDAFLAGPHIEGLNEELRAAIAEHGLRNGLLTSIAPTGTISLIAGNVSSGIEPVFSFVHKRKVRLADGSTEDDEITNYAYADFRRRFGADAPLPEAFVTAQTLTPADHLAMQAAVQAHVDASISKTINVPRATGFEDFKDIYMSAFDLGLKGCTTYRPNAVTGAVLSLPDPAKQGHETQPALPLDAPPGPLPAMDPNEGADVVYLAQPLDRDRVLPGFTYKLKWPDSDHAIYITINDLVESGNGPAQGGRRRPFEIFINSKNMEHYAWTVALTRMISAVFRRGGDVSFVVEELKAVFDPRGGQWMEGRYVPSLLAAIGGVIERHMIDTGFLMPEEQAAPTENPGVDLRFCPKCDQPALVQAQGCLTCLACGYSKCG
ncbi:Ribonucleotide reductase of class II (coenzyme B12-dependent) [hydrothermal vent metagenome]|uniref:Vitamin B12-dependent ribonucleotide reductase n=1 Tax=hydrothermal vent metagenome TaxID=652676 RepID=A0A3B0TSA4_9ZZZZ